MSTNSGVDAHTSRKRISVASCIACASAALRIWNRRTTSLPYRARTFEGGGVRSQVGSFSGDGREQDFGMPQMVSMAQSRRRIHGRRGSDVWDRNWTGSTGGGGVMLEPAGTAETVLMGRKMDPTRTMGKRGRIFRSDGHVRFELHRHVQVLRRKGR